MKNTLYINVFERLGETLNTRIAATSLFEFVSEIKCDAVNFDFDQVVFMSRSFADQFHKDRMTLQGQNKVVIEICNAESNIREMLTTVASTQEKKDRYYRVLPVFTFTNDEKLEDYLLSI
ncbi:MAG: hypothetical protein PHQ74_02225 [Crocinitomicaceae bacterium]|nr:hypothetical protein [Crocinitomicaceae bacterium]